MNGTATPGAVSSSGVGGGSGCGIIMPHLGSQQALGGTELGVTGSSAVSSTGGGQAGDRGSCSADSGVRGSSDRESGGATSVGGNLSDSTTDGELSYILLFTTLQSISISSCYSFELDEPALVDIFQNPTRQNLSSPIRRTLNQASYCCFIIIDYASGLLWIGSIMKII